MTSTELGRLVTAVCLAGTVLNVKKVRWCFHLWTIGNLLWLAIDIRNSLYSRALLDFVQLVLAVWGMVEWQKDRRLLALIVSHFAIKLCEGFCNQIGISLFAIVCIGIVGSPDG